MAGCSPSRCDEVAAPSSVLAPSRADKKRPLEVSPASPPRIWHSSGSRKVLPPATRRFDGSAYGLRCLGTHDSGSTHGRLHDQFGTRVQVQLKFKLKTGENTMNPAKCSQI